MPLPTRISLSTLLLTSFLLLATAPQSSSAIAQVGNAPSIRHVQHAHEIAANQKRMIKIRQGLLPGGGGRQNADDPTDPTDDTNQPGGGGAGGGRGGQQRSSTTSAAPTQSQTSSSAAATSSTPESASQQSTSSSAAPTSSEAPTSTSAAPTSTAPPSTQSLPTSSTGPRSIIFSSTIDPAATETTLPDNKDTGTSSFGKNSLIAIIVIASCVGGAAAIWTLIRKWKLGPSAKFDERMQPIEWAPDPDSTAGGAAGVPGLNREKDGAAGVAGAAAMGEKHRRGDSAGSHGSFHSSDADHRGGLGRNVTGNANMFADQNPGGYAPEAHDFTAGPVNYGSQQPGYDAYNSGYVDLQRSNSGGRGGYDHGYGQSYPPNAGYGGAQDAYGGYDAYGQQPQAGYGATGNDPYGQHAAYGGAAYGGARY